MNLQEEIFAVLREILQAHPYLRVAQVIHNATSGADIFYWSDEKLLRTLQEYKVRFSE